MNFVLTLKEEGRDRISFIQTNNIAHCYVLCMLYCYNVLYCSQLSLSVSPLESLHPPLLVVHLRVDVSQLPLQSLNAGPGVVNVRLEEVRVILGT